MFNRVYYKNIGKEIASTMGRFLAILAITALGSGFYAGLKSTGPAMISLADNYFRDQRLMDYQIYSTLGFSNTDLDSIRQVQGMDNVLACQSLDAITDKPDNTVVFRYTCIPKNRDENNPDYLNRLVLTDGRFPKKTDECLVDSKVGLKIGDKISISKTNTKELLDKMAQKEFTVVGMAKSPMYISFQRGNTNIGNGRINGYCYIMPKAFDLDIYSAVYIRENLSDSISSFSPEYADMVDKGVENLEALGKKRAGPRREEVLEDANKELGDAQQKLDDAKLEADQKLDDASKKIQDAEADLEEGKLEISKNENKLNDARRKSDDGETQIQDAYGLLDGKKGELESGRAELEKQQQTIKNGESKLEKSENQYNYGNEQYQKGVVQLEQAKQELAQGEVEYSKGLEKYNSSLQEYDTAIQQINDMLAGLDNMDAAAAELQNIAANIQNASTTEEAAAYSAAFEQVASSLIASLQGMANALIQNGAGQIGEPLLQAAGAAQGALDTKDYPLVYGVLSGAIGSARQGLVAMKQATEARLPELEQARITLAETRAKLDSGALTIDVNQSKLDETRDKLAFAKQEIDDGRAKLNDGKKQLSEAGEKLKSGEKAITEGYTVLETKKAELEDAKGKIAEGWQKLQDAKAELGDGETKLSEGKQEYSDAKIEADTKLGDAQQEINDAQDKINDIKDAEWFVLTRDDNPGYSGFSSDADRINNIAILIPVFFFLVAALVCLTTMTRMVEEQRGQIGTFKALGYHNSAIAMKYLLYAWAASVAGSILGVLAGSVIFPKAIWNAYQMMYIMPPIGTYPHPFYGPVSVITFVLTTSLATLLACISELKSVPSSLMRPKAPKPGKRVLLERIPWLWKRLNFSQKVTIHNLFRYKRRLFMTVVGISGCTAMLLTGFGLRDSSLGIVGIQFGTIYKYDMTVALKSHSNSAQDTPVNKALSNYGKFVYVTQSLVKVSHNGYVNGDMTINAYVPDNPDVFSDFIRLYSAEDKENIKFPYEKGSVVVTEKLAKDFSLKVGDSFNINKLGEKPAIAKVAGISENYLINFVYMTPETYKHLFGVTPEFSTVLLRLPEERLADKQTILESLLEVDGVAGAVLTDEVRSNASDMLDSLNAVVWVIIASSAALAFVVLYNLTNINITERQREIATLKVLGFFDNEVSAYVYRENILLTLIGIAVGLSYGVLLHMFVIKTAEVDEMMFIQSIKPLSYLWAVLFTLACAMLVNLAMMGRLKKIDMVESLKSAE